MYNLLQYIIGLAKKNSSRFLNILLYKNHLIKVKSIIYKISYGVAARSLGLINEYLDDENCILILFIFDF